MKRKHDHLHKNTSGFTIVELLIVVVVIAILAAITLVAFNNITSRANDAARASDASNLGKKAELRNATVGTYGYGEAADEPTSRSAWLALYEAEALSTQLVVCGFDTCPLSGESDEYDRTKIYVQSPSADEIRYAYWSNEQDKWLTVRHASWGVDRTSYWEGPDWLYSLG